MRRRARAERGFLARLDPPRDLAVAVRERELALRVKMAWFDAQPPAERAALRHARFERPIPEAFTRAELARAGAVDAHGRLCLPKLTHFE